MMPRQGLKIKAKTPDVRSHGMSHFATVHVSTLTHTTLLDADARVLLHCRPRGGAVWQLVGLITRRSSVQIRPPQPTSTLPEATATWPRYFLARPVSPTTRPVRGMDTDGLPALW